MKKKFIIIISIALLLCTTMVIPVSADIYDPYITKSPYYSYEYNAYNELTSAPDGYIPTDIKYFDNIGLDMSESVISDVYFDGNDIYLLDSGCGRLIILNKDFTLKQVLDSSNINCGKFKDFDITFTGASGIFIEDNGQILICDTERERIIILKDGVVKNLITRPETTVISDDIKFDVKKVIKTGANYYVVVESVVSGVMVFDENYEFLKIFGSNKVAVTSEVLLQKLQNIYMSDEQIAARRKFTASKINGIDIDENGFVVVVSSDPELTISGSAVRCLNFKGSEVDFGDEDVKFGDTLITVNSANAFSDISVDKENFYVLLDTKYGRIFVYSEKGLLVSCFGGLGDEIGLFEKPSVVETIEDKIVVLDSADNSLTIFSPTDYAKVKRDLICIIDGGNLPKIEELTQKLLKYNTNCQYAHYARGFVAEQKGDYVTAMDYYKLGNDRESYAQVFKLYRTQYLNDNILWVALIVISLIVGIVFGLIYLSNGLRKSEGAIYVPLESNKAGFPIYCLFHPTDGFWQLKIRRMFSPIWLITIIVLFVYSGIAGFLSNGFIFNMNQPEDFNVIIQLAKTIGLLAIFVIANWSICTIMEGKGRPKDILYVFVYALIPYVVTQLIKMLLTHILISEEAILITIITSIGVIWTCVVLFVGLITIHEYNVGKAIFSIVLTVFAMFIILLLIVMFYILVGQTVSFVGSIIQEYTLQH